MASPGEQMLLARKLIRHGKRTATIAPSSQAICEAMSHDLDARKPQTIIELGAGTGPITSYLEQRMHPESRLLSFEIDPDLAEACRRRCPRAEVIEDSAANFLQHTRERGIEHIDLFINALPTPSLPRAVNQPVFEGFREMADDDVEFMQITVMPWVYKRLYQRLFDSVDFTLIMKNVPPGGVYRCRGLKHDFLQHLPGR